MFERRAGWVCWGPRASRLLAAAGACLALAGCSREPRAEKKPTSTQASTIATQPARPLPQYEFVPGLVDRYPQVAGFVRQFLETCLAGDYRGYRRLVSRSAVPEAEERFNAIYRNVLRVTIESIEPRETGAGGGPAAPFHLVIAGVEFDPESNIALRHESRRIALLVFQEAGEYRMAPAPDALQPASQPASASAPAESGPSYPWDEVGDD